MIQHLRVCLTDMRSVNATSMYLTYGCGICNCILSQNTSGKPEVIKVRIFLRAIIYSWTPTWDAVPETGLGKRC